MSRRMIILPSDVISALNSATVLVGTCVCFTVHVEDDILSCCMSYPPKSTVAFVVTSVCHLACR